MYIWFSLGVIAVVVVGVVAFTSVGTYLKTGWLILQTNPYEQSGSGAGQILVVGDSTGYGTGVSKASQSVAGRLGAMYPEYRIENNSQNSRRTASAQEVVETLTQQYDLIVLQIGANDLLAGESAATVADKVQALAKAATTHANAVVIMTAGNIGGSVRFTGQQAEQYRSASKAYDDAMQTYAAGTTNVWFVSLYDEPAEDPFVIAPETYMSLDGLHPSAAGYDIWFSKASPAFTAALAGGE